MSADSVIVLGAGVVGVCTALALRQRGRHVILIDRKPPASETSGGNAGIISAGSAVPQNHPGLRKQLPSLLLGDSAGLRFHLPYAIANCFWLARYLRHATVASTARRARALHPLLLRSQSLHRRWISTAGLQENLRDTGWLKCYRSERGFDDAATERGFWDDIGVEYEIIDAARLGDLLPTAASVFVRAVHLRNTLSVIDPQKIVLAYCAQFVAAGGVFMQNEIAALQQTKNGWQVLLANGATESAKNVVVALGPWAKSFLKTTLGMRLPMAFERGAHRQFTATKTVLDFPVADVEAGYILGQHGQKLRLSTGVYFAGLNAKPPLLQLDAAERHLRATFADTGAAISDWYGARPTMPDSLPCIGGCKKQGLWLAFGHQHIGLSIAPATAELIANAITRDTPVPLDFAPARFGV